MPQFNEVSSLIQHHNSNRIAWVDCLKGIGIILMVAGHSNSPFNVFIYAFHMPLFFIISGYTIKPDQNLTLSFTWSRIQSLLVPYISFSVLIILITSVLSFSLPPLSTVFPSPTNPLEQIKNLLLYLSTPSVAGATWFLVVLFFSNLIVLFVKKISPKGYLLILLGSYAATYYLIGKKIFFPYNLDLAILGAFYVALGMRLRTSLNSFNYRPFTKLSLLFALAASVCLYYFTKIHWAPMNWPTRSFDKFFLNNILAALAGFYIIFLLSNIAPTSRVSLVLSTLGKNTMGILLFHFISFKIIFSLFITLGLENFSYLNNLTPPEPKYWFTVTTLSLIISMLSTKMIAKNRLLSRLLLGKTLKPTA